VLLASSCQLYEQCHAQDAPEFWEQKLSGNVARDKRNIMALRQMGWRVRVIWECEVTDEIKLRRSLQQFFRITS
jgi:G:T-mismatch repair DNA endonuclease (very short patch repair protein)